MRSLNAVVAIIMAWAFLAANYVYAYPISRDELMINTMSFMEEKIRDRSMNEAFGYRSVLDNLHPYLDLEEAYNDNIFKVHETPSPDWIDTITPGILYKWNSLEQKTSAFIDLGAAFKNYAHLSQYNVINPAIVAEIEHALRKYGFSLRFQLDKSQLSYSETEVTEQKGFVNMWVSYLIAHLEMEAGRRFLFSLIGTHKRGMFSQTGPTPMSNYDDEYFDFTSYIKVLPKTSLLLEFIEGKLNQYRNKTVPNTKNTYYKYFGGIEGEITTKVNGVIKGGLELRRYKETNKLDKKPTVNIGLEYLPTKLTTLKLDILREIATTTYNEATAETLTYSLGGSYMPPFSKRLLLKGEMSYSDLDYGDRQEQDYDISLSLEYKFKQWLKLTGKYNLHDKASTNTDAKFRNNVYSLKLESEF